MTRGRFFVLDGSDGSGKTTQARRLTEDLGRDHEVLHLREPGSTALGESLRALLLDPAHAIGPAVEAMLFAASRRQTLDELVAPALAAGTHIVCERFHASTFAYQGTAGGLDEQRVLELLSEWAGAPRPDLELVIAVDPKAAFARRSGVDDRIEAKGLEFQERVAAGYLRYAELVAAARVIDGGGSEDEVAAAIRAEVQRVLD